MLNNMSKGFDKVHIKDAVKSHSRFDLSRRHITSLNIGQILPICSDELVPNDVFNVNHSVFARVAPMVVPTYGDVQFRTQTVFVPFHQVFEGIDSFIGGQAKYKGRTLKMPVITLGELFAFFQKYSSVVASPSGNDSFDWQYRADGSSTVFYRFSEQGKYYYKVMRCLGYAIPRNINTASSSVWTTTDSKVTVSALPLLCFAKGYCDWMQNSYRYNTSELTSVLDSIARGVNVTNVFNNSDGKLTATGIETLLKYVTVQYDDNYFTTAWESPNSPLASVGSIDSINADRSMCVSGNKIYNFNDKSMFVPTTVPEYGTAIVQRTLDYLQAFDSWVRRNNYAGSKDVEQIYSRFGVKIDDFRARYAYMVGDSTTSMSIGDVTATSNSVFDSEEMPIGDYVGKGIVNGGNGFSFRASDFGMLITYGYLTVRPLYAKGFNRTVMHTQPLDFYTPEFDTLQAQAISLSELRAYEKGGSAQSGQYGEIFGFCPRFNEYRFARDMVTGDMELMEQYQCWHLQRNLELGSQSKAQSSAIMQMPQTNSEFNRIFTVTDGLEDKFLIDFKYNVNATRPIKTLSGSLDLGEGDLDMSLGGTTLN